MTENNTPTLQLTEENIFLTRIMDAPRDLVWKAFSEAERLAQWWGPKGCNVRVVSLDFRPGGIFHYAMQTSDGSEMWGKFVYREIVPQERILFVLSFADAQGNTVRAPFSPTWPLEMLNETRFFEQDGKTKLTMAAAPLNPTAEEQQSFEAELGGMKQGTNGALDQLADYLASVTA